MKIHSKKDYPLDQIRRHLETGPIVLVSSAWKGQVNIMTMGWHMMLQFTPALLACYIWEGNRSFRAILNSRECVINIPTMNLVDQVVGIGNSTGGRPNKFANFGLTPVAAEHVAAPLIGECYASFECRLADSSQVSRYGLFIWEVVKAHVADTPRHPRTLHYRGQGEFMLAGRAVNLRDRFKTQNL